MIMPVTQQEGMSLWSHRSCHPYQAIMAPSVVSPWSHRSCHPYQAVMAPSVVSPWSHRSCHLYQAVMAPSVVSLTSIEPGGAGPVPVERPSLALDIEHVVFAGVLGGTLLAAGSLPRGAPPFRVAVGLRLQPVPLSACSDIRNFMSCKSWCAYDLSVCLLLTRSANPLPPNVQNVSPTVIMSPFPMAELVPLDFIQVSFEGQCEQTDTVTVMWLDFLSETIMPHGCWHVLMQQVSGAPCWRPQDASRAHPL
jgi:hypothetical protein